MRIAFISTMSIYPWGGSEELWYNAALNALESGKHTVLISVFKHKTTPSKIEYLIQKGAYLLFKSNSAGKLSPFKRLIKTLSVDRKKHYKDILNWKPDFVFVSQGGTFDFLKDADLLNLLDSFPNKYAIICHGNLEGTQPGDEQREKAKKYISQALFIGFVAEWAKKLCEKQILDKIKNAKFFVNPLNLHSLDTMEYNLPEDIVRMATVGSLTIEWKGQDIILEILSAPKWKIRNWNLSIYGSGKDYNYIDGLIKYYGLEEKVNLKGHTNNIKEIWESHHLHLMPSRVETSPIALVEAMICAIPSVITDVGGVKEWVSSENAFIARAANTAEFDNALEFAWNNKPLWNEFGEKGRIAALERIREGNNDLLTSIPHL